VSIPLYIRVLPLQLAIAALFIVPAVQVTTKSAEAMPAQKSSHVITAVPAQRKAAISGTPVRITVPRLNIDLPVAPGTYDATRKQWSIADTTANYATDTAAPNDTINKTFIYGHWSDGVFGRTKNLVSGDIAFVYTSNGHRFQYKFQEAHAVAPDQADKVFATFIGDPGLVLMTCQGWWAQERRMMYFNYESVS
jgi:LPXTG-site transpeptidase (sortase) family protein